MMTTWDKVLMTPLNETAGLDALDRLRPTVPYADDTSNNIRVKGEASAVEFRSTFSAYEMTMAARNNQPISVATVEPASVLRSRRFCVTPWGIC